MIEVDPNQPLYDPSMGFIPMDTFGGNPMFMNQPGVAYAAMPPARPKQSILTRIGNLHLPAIIILAFSWILHTLATFLPYWSTSSKYSGSRAGEALPVNRCQLVLASRRT